jgi:hypothetical protein
VQDNTGERGASDEGAPHVALKGADLWRGAPGPKGEGANIRKRGVVNATPRMMLERAHSIGTTTQTRKRLVVDWLEALTVEQMFAERIVRDGIRYDTQADEDAKGCSPLAGRHVWTGVEIALRRVLVSLPGAWQPLEFRCTTCKSAIAGVFLVERDTERGEWMRITNATPAPLRISFDGLSRHTLADPLTFPPKVRRVYEMPTPSALAMLGEVAHVIEPPTPEEPS